ncbi:MAG: GNAT family N-acetyltransferase [Sulfurospirillaceae bacterium]|nr:GNAT family N-acetyltransferase [Sulfurospirillaceae bacterium]
MQVVTKLTENQIKQLHVLYQNEWWCSERSLEDTKICVENSQVIIGIIDDHGNLKGFSRILTDTIFKALIFDVIVAPEYRAKGLGKLLVNAIKTNEMLKNVKHFELYCKSDMVSFYESYGFTCNVGDIQLMRWSNT